MNSSDRLGKNDRLQFRAVCKSTLPYLFNCPKSFIFIEIDCHVPFRMDIRLFQCITINLIIHCSSSIYAMKSPKPKGY